MAGDDFTNGTQERMEKNEKRESAYGQHRYSDRRGDRHSGADPRPLADRTVNRGILPLGDLGYSGTSDPLHEPGKKTQGTAVKEDSDQRHAEGNEASGTEASESISGRGNRAASASACEPPDLGLSACAVSKGYLGMV